MSLFSKKTDVVVPAKAGNQDKSAPAPAKAKAEVSTKASASRPKVLSGIVTSTKMKDTIVVKVDRFVKAPKYERFVKISKKYKAHDAGNTKKEGERVDIVEVAPISKDKHFKVL